MPSNCFETKSPRGPRQIPKGTVSARNPLDIVAIHGSSRRHSEHKGSFNYIMIMQDVFSKYVIAVPLKTKECAEVAAAYNDSLVRPFGAPRAILSDQGKEFSGPEMKKVCAEHGTRRLATTPYHPLYDGMV